MMSLNNHHSLTCFFNSFFLEWNEVERSKEKFILDLKNGEKLLIPVKTFSILGRHHYGDTFQIESKAGVREVGFEEIIHKISDYLSLEFKTEEKQKENFINRVLNSDYNIKLSLHKREADIHSLYNQSIDFNKAEQGLFIGHTFHPTPKSRSEFSDADYDVYSPEMAGHFPLEWVLLSEDIYFQKLSKNFRQDFWIEEAFLTDFNDQSAARAKLKEGYTPFPLHPWQKQFIFKSPVIQNYIKEAKIISLGASDKEWFPTSSLRTLYNPESDYMLKFSMDLRLTNSIRRLLVHELDRGLQVHDVFTTKMGESFIKDHPQFEVIYEPAYAGIRDLDGNPLQETLIVGRFNPFKEKSESIVLATLTQDHPMLKENLAQNYIQKFATSKRIDFKTASLLWFKEFLQVCIRPLIKAQADYGILLGSHQQNMVVEMKDHLPYKSYFRDCNGTGYSTLGHELFSNEVSSLVVENGNILDFDIASYLFGYYVVINSTFNMISSIAHAGNISEQELISEFRAELVQIKKENPKDSSFLDYLLERKTLLHKGNFLCCFKNINENTEKNPLSIYTEIPNPLNRQGL